MRLPTLTRALAPLSATLLVCGCAVGPDFQRPSALADAGYANMPASQPGDGASQAVRLAADIPADWWTLFRSPELDALVRRALASNPDLEAARAALRQSQALLKAERGAYLPSASLEASTLRSREPGVLASPLESDRNLYTLNTAQLNVGYSLDLFGGARRQVEASRALAEAQRFQTEAARLTIASNVVLAAITAASLQDQIDATQQGLAVQRRILAILKERQRLGDAARAEVVAQETQLAQAEQALGPLQKDLAQQHDLLAALTGRIPSDTDRVRLDLAALALPKTLPLSLPAKLVDQRPDVRAAEANVHAAAAQVGVAVAARLPSISLSGTSGGSSTRVASLLSPDNLLWSVAGGLTAPLFEGGALRNRQRVAEAEYDQAKALYRSAVIAAFQNVSDVLAAITADTAALRAAERAERAAAESRDIAQGQARLGAIAPMETLNADLAYWESTLALQQARAAVCADSVALFQALGGGWWNRA
jgi:NodT family efflux transporter outer membrane factor (OMF) lipoprotein